MRTRDRIALLPVVLLFLLLAVIPASAQIIYSNGPINGTTDAWTINFGYVVSDTFTLSSYAWVQGFDFGVWEFPGDVLSSVDWSITSAENGGTTYGSGTASGVNLTDQFISSNQYGYNIDKITVSGLNVPLNADTYWLNLQNAAVSSGDPVYWDENSGPSQASESAVGTIPSEAFDVSGGCTCCGNHDAPDCGPPTPEPSSILLFGSGIVGLAGLLRRKLF
jgi:hypothetical protein